MKIRVRIAAGIIGAFVIFVSACSEFEKPKTEKFYSKTRPPNAQEFRWANGKFPESFDPATASAPPETDVVRALYDGLTDTEPQTLNAIPAIAVNWKSSEGDKVWTFTLRTNAKWSNGKTVNADDFVRSWKRLAEMGEGVSQNDLLKNIVGMDVPTEIRKPSDMDQTAELDSQNMRSNRLSEKRQFDTPGSRPRPTSSNKGRSVEEDGQRNINPTQTSESRIDVKHEEREKLGVEATGEFELKVTLHQPDKDFPKLAAHPVFRPVYQNGDEFKENKLNPRIVTNGAFTITSVADSGISLKRSTHYWNKDRVKLETVRFIPTTDAESALQAYRDGRVDAVTNAQFEPLVLKLLTPFSDFRRVTHSALNFYEFNRQKPPFNDRRVRQALAISIERERLTRDEMDGATVPADKFLPFSPNGKKGKLGLNATKARELMRSAGFANGERFPTVRLVVNRNNIQQRIAKSVARMWKKELNIETDVIVKETSEIEKFRSEGDFDVLRRGVVLPTSDETANMLAIFKPTRINKPDSAKGPKSNRDKAEPDTNGLKEPPGDSTKPVLESERSLPGDSNDGNLSDRYSGELIIDIGGHDYILTEDEALLEVPGIPLYFPTSYSLVKPYVIGFEMNTLDAPSLKDVEINSSWQPEKTKSES